MSERKNKKRKKHLRRTTAEIERDFIVYYEKYYIVYFYSVLMQIVESFMEVKVV